MNVQDYKRALAMVDDYTDEYIRIISREAKAFLEEEFGLVMSIPIKLNGRLTRALGRFVYKSQSRQSLRIEISKRAVADAILTDEWDTVFDILHHECVHYALFEREEPFCDSDLHFQQACTSRGVSLTGTTDVHSLKHRYVCGGGHVFMEDKKIDGSKYACGRCKTPLEYEGEIIHKIIKK